MALYDSYTTGDDYSAQYYSTVWGCQTFIASANYTITSVRLKIYKGGTPGTVTVSLRAVDASHKPTGADLASGTIDGNALTTSSPGEWVEITFGTSYGLSSGTEYAIVVRAASSYLYWRADTSSPAYSNGIWCHSIDSGATWTDDSSVDHMFETYGSGPVIHDVAGAVTLAAALTGASVVTFGATGTIPSVFGLVGYMTGETSVEGAIACTFSLSAYMIKLFQRDTTVPIKRLIAAANNQIWYEEI